MLEVVGCSVLIGGYCIIWNYDGLDVEVEVVGFFGNKMYLMFIELVSGLQLGVWVIFNCFVVQVLVGMNLLGCVFDGCG